MRASAFIIVVFGASLLAQTPAPPPAQPLEGGGDALRRIEATERAFAAATAEIGVRDGFLSFFAADAVRVVTPPDAPVRLEPAREFWMSRPLQPLPLASRLSWAPFTGHASADGALGWLTGAYVVTSETVPPQRLDQGGYFSVWKRQADGTWRVWLDEGVGFPQPWEGAEPFRVAAEPEPGTAGQPGESLADVEREIAAGGAAWAARVDRSARMHRHGVMPIVGRDAVVAWAAGAWSSVTFTTIAESVAGSNDLGVAIGGYEAASGAGPERGMWVRVWRRDVTGRWRIVFETSRPQA